MGTDLVVEYCEELLSFPWGPDVLSRSLCGLIMLRAVPKFAFGILCCKFVCLNCDK